MLRAVILFLGVCLTAGTPCEAQQSGWLTDFENAQRRAVETQQPLLIHFKSPWCGPCLQMDRQVLHDPRVESLLNEGLVCVVVDISRRDDLASRYGVETIPRDVAVMADGRVRTLNIGKLSVSEYAALLQRLARDGASSRPSRDLVQAEKAPATSPETYEQDPAPEQAALTGLDGFCPVRLHEAREWVAGDQQLNAQYRGIQYYFSSEAARDEFIKNPARYAPQNLGCDPVVLLSTQKAVTGSIRYGAFFDNQLFLFSSIENKNEFKKSPLRFTQIRQAIRAEQIEGTRFQ